MGTWGYNLLETDAAGDLVVIWKKYVLRGREVDPEYWIGEQIVDFFRRVYFRSPFRGAFPHGGDLKQGELKQHFNYPFAM